MSNRWALKKEMAKRWGNRIAGKAATVRKANGSRGGSRGYKNANRNGSERGQQVKCPKPLLGNGAMTGVRGRIKEE